MQYAIALKYNPYHDPKSGRFTFKHGIGANFVDGVWVGHTGKPLPERILAKIKKHGVTGATHDVQVNDNDEDHLQIVGKDAKGKTQYWYSSEHKNKAAADKFKRLKAFHKAIPRVSVKVEKILTGKRTSPVDRDCSAICRMIELTGFRVGSKEDTGADVKAYGATTMLREHVSVNGDSISFDFIGKKGVRQQKTITDPILARYLESKGEGRLFPDVTYSKVDRFFDDISGDKFSLKDYRTWHGTTIALRELAKYAEPSTKKEATAIRQVVLKEVSDFLGNTPAIAKDSYVDPAVWGPLDKLLITRKKKAK
jgi:DNA topoisomerase I